MAAKASADKFRTDTEGWRLKVSEDSHGQHKWVYLPPGPQRDAWPQTAVDKYSQGLETVSFLYNDLTRRAFLTSQKRRPQWRPLAMG